MLADENTTKIFHYGRADIAHIKYYLKTETNNILDTKIASKLARSYSDSHSLKTLIKEFINIDISKQFQSSDFGGELSSAQLKYCANDVMYLHKIHEELNKILERENRIDLYKDCLRFLKTRVNLDLALFKDDIWSPLMTKKFIPLAKKVIDLEIQALQKLKKKKLIIHLIKLLLK